MDTAARGKADTAGNDPILAVGGDGAGMSVRAESGPIRTGAGQGGPEERTPFQTLFDEAPLGIFLVDSDFRIQEVNAAARPFFVVRPFFGGITDVIGRDFDEVAHVLWVKENADEIVRLVRHTLETRESYATPERIEDQRHEGGAAYYEWRIRPFPMPDGQGGVVCYFRDVTARVLAWAAVAESEEERRRTAEGLRAIAARAHCLLWYAEVEDRGERDLHWTLRVADEEAARRFLPIVIPFGHSYGRALAEARLPEDRARMTGGDDKVRAGHSYRQEFRVRDVDGNIRWLAEDVQIETRSPGHWYAVGVCVDITERKRAEAERETHLAEIENLNNRLQRAMTETHHRVKNNLQLVSALIDLCRTAHPDTVPAEEFTRLSASVRTLSIIHDILTKETKAGGDQEALSAKAVLEQLLQGIGQIAGEHALTYTVDDVRLAGRQATSLALVTNELVANALKYGLGKVRVAFRVAEGEAALEVCDEGPGFPDGFDPATAAQTGLDLIVNIVQWDLRGKVSFANRHDAEPGARITVTFPLTGREGQSGEAPPAE